jgi:hypothetical protein
MKNILLLALVLITAILYSEEGKSFFTEKRGEFTIDTSDAMQIPVNNFQKVKMNEKSQEFDYPKDVYEFPKTNDFRFLTFSQKIEYSQLPTILLENISTHALIETCLNYPILNMVEEKSFKSIFESFNGYNELIQRQDVTEILLSIYNKTTYASYSTLVITHKLTVFSYMLCNEDVMALFNRSEKICLLEYTLNKPNYPESKELLIATILLNFEYSPMIKLMIQNKLIRDFVKEGSIRMFPPKLITEIGDRFVAEHRKGSN